MTEPLSTPRRLLETAGPAGDCLRRARLESLSFPPPRFAELRERRLRRSQRRWSALLISVVALSLVMLHAVRRDERAPSIRAEPSVLATAPAPEAPSLQPQPTEHERPFPPQATAATSRPRRPHPTARAAHALVPRDAEAGGASSAKACAELARSGDAQLALDCYAPLAGGSGLSAELALFEAARLEGKVLRRSARAVQILERYRQRFPQGSLRGEAILAEIGWLLADGKDERARALVDEALASGLLRERTAELERLRERLAHTAVSE